MPHKCLIPVPTAPTEPPVACLGLGLSALGVDGVRCLSMQGWSLAFCAWVLLSVPVSVCCCRFAGLHCCEGLCLLHLLRAAPALLLIVLGGHCSSGMLLSLLAPFVPCRMVAMNLQPSNAGACGSCHTLCMSSPRLVRGTGRTGSVCNLLYSLSFQNLHRVHTGGSHFVQVVSGVFIVWAHGRALYSHSCNLPVHLLSVGVYT